MILIGGLWLISSFWPSPGLAQGTSPLIVGSLQDDQAQPIEGAEVTLLKLQGEDPLTSTTSQPNGRFNLSIPDNPSGPLKLHIKRPHFEPYSLTLSPEDVAHLKAGETVIIPPITLERHISIAFWLATLVFILMLVMIATGVLHTTLAALVGATLVLIISYASYLVNEELFIFNFNGSLKYIDWNVIFLIMGMMIYIAIVEQTGIFQWLALFAYRISGGRWWLLLPILMLFTGVASAFLDNVTTMLLMTPISIQIALSLGINPLALLIPEVLASNVIGISTLIGTPTNILIGSYGEITFNDFLTNLTPGVMLAFIGLVIYCALIYRSELRQGHGIPEAMLEKLAERGHIANPDHLRKAGWIGLGMLVLFIVGDSVNLLPAVTALIGATALLVWIRPDVEEMIEAVDWTTLVFFMALFIVVGAIQEVGLISFIASSVGKLVGTNLPLALLVVTWFSALFSTVVANIPFTAAMLPVIGFLTATIPGAQSKALYFSLSVGSAMGGNGSLIGASANMVTAGIAERVGYSISYSYFFKKGFPALLLTVGLGTIWLIVHFL